jgi:hypothetical protein
MCFLRNALSGRKTGGAEILSDAALLRDFIPATSQRQQDTPSKNYQVS